MSSVHVFPNIFQQFIIFFSDMAAIHKRRKMLDAITAAMYPKRYDEALLPGSDVAVRGYGGDRSDLIVQMLKIKRCLKDKNKPLCQQRADWFHRLILVR